jgi:hypothetical protein
VDNAGRRVEGGSTGDSMRIEDVTDVTDITDEERKRNDKGYEEKMEDEYAKREGGA